MTNHDDLHDIETRLRASLRERAGDVETTPALYERVQEQAARGAWLRRGFAVAAAAAVVVGAFVVVPALLPDPAPFDVVDTPEESLPSDGPTADEDTQPAVPDGSTDDGDPFVMRSLVRAEVQPDGTTEIVTGARSVRTTAGVTSLVSGPDGLVVAALTDGTVGVVLPIASAASEFDLVVPADPNGGGVVPMPGGAGIAWLEGSNLHVLPLGDGAQQVRVLPLEGDVPDDLRIEQWFAQADAQVVLASAPAGGVWSLPMDDSDVFNTAPTSAGFVLDAAALDSALLPDLSRVDVAPTEEGTTTGLVIDGRPAAVDFEASRALRLTTSDQAVVVHDPSTGRGALHVVADGALGPADFSWDAATITAVAPLGQFDVQEATSSAEAAELGLPTDAPLIGTDGVELVVRRPDGSVTRAELYPSAESEAVLGDLAVRPGSSVDGALVAVESTSEGEPSIRFVRFGPDEPEVAESILLTQGAVTGLVWSEDGAAIAWSDAAGLHVATIDDTGTVLDSGPVYDGTRPLLDWVWTDGDGDRTSGQFAVRTDDDGTQFLGVDRLADGAFEATGPTDAVGGLVLDTHTSPGAAVGPDVTAELFDAEVVLRWSADGDRFGQLASLGDVGSAVQVEVSGGHALVFGTARHVLVTFDGDVVELPVLTDWDVLD